ncbi:cell division protein FtsK [Listeria monocytogenes]|uniref:cell division protein FtsK n=1 Tax=Listeria monocytogenes TaxID=1639 RepID=UPI000873D617|nr:cell division protein FtsK [Listeria monocytogenes]EAD9483308.1 cell division protein FtsK [Listeria monocytogenes]EAE5673645.1 cell division protein FtsK [Listeria monocytogenes]EAG0962325.1 cell division protein FtsK [Listeria monocytogenes]EAG0969841.1 cell division protein FtsK [Listeria monocytogenes]EAG0986823.1 cell division protein FtsK [Listeria monocytogenes]
MRQFVEKHIYKRRGRRIRYKTKDTLLRAGIAIAVSAFLLLMSLLLLVFPVLPAIDYSFKLGEIPTYLAQMDYGLFLVECSLSIVIALCLVFISKVLFYEKYILLKQRQTLARLVIDRRYYETEQVSKENLFDFDISWGNKQGKEKIAYFPKIYFQAKEGYLYVRFPTDGRAYQEQFLQLNSTLETAFYGELESVIREDGYICYKLLYAIARDRLNIKELHSDKGKLALMKRTVWDFDKLPHMLVSGGTGAGKTYTILSVLLGLLKGACKKEDIIICDPKNADLADLKDIFPHVFYAKGGIKASVRTFKNDMLARSTEMKEMDNYVTGKNYRFLGLRPQFLIFDEFVAYMEMLDYKEQAELLSDLKQIVMLGRQAGYFLIVGLQRPDARYLADGIRDQFHLRIALGRNSDTGYTMMFGETNKKFTFKEIPGFGYVDAGKGVISEFYSPLVDASFDFITEFKKEV